MVAATQGSFQFKYFKIFKSNNPVRYPWNIKANQVSRTVFKYKCFSDLGRTPHKYVLSRTACSHFNCIVSSPGAISVMQSICEQVLKIKIYNYLAI